VIDPPGSVPPEVSIVICTRDRPDDLPMAVSSVLASVGEVFELVVVDQSTTAASRDYLATIDDPRLRVVCSDEAGLSRARNLGLASAACDIVLMTDDDCVVDPRWLAGMSAALRRDPAAAAVFGPVSSGPCDASLGFVPDGPITRERRFTRARQYDPRAGIGASVGFRRAAVLEVGGFDTALGAGAPFKSAEEIDIVLRLLLAGHTVVHDRATNVVHHGFRTYDQARTLVRGYMYGTAACHTKLLRLGHMSVLVPLGRALWGSLVPPVVSALRRRRFPPVAGRIAWIARGVLAGARAPIDRPAGRFAT
jgi:GT2 family glycosyltransferase